MLACPEEPLAAEEARALLDAINTGTVVGMRDRALIALMAAGLDTEVVLTCPDCNHKFAERLGRLYDDRSVICPGCGERLRLTSGSVRCGARRCMYNTPGPSPEGKWDHDRNPVCHR